MGLKILYCPESVLTHFEQVSLKAKGNLFKKKTTRNNNKVFLRKWGKRLEKFRLANDFEGLKPFHYYHHTRSDVIRLVPREAGFVLDVGCASGMLGKALKEKNKSLIVWGVEKNKHLAKEAGENLDRVWVGDIEQMEDLFEGAERFDCIIFSDILEHLQDPWTVLRKFRGLCAQGGKIICSIPNIRYYKVIKDILRDRWLYREEGILDKDHLRFFSLATIRNLFALSGFRIEKIEEKRKAGWIMKWLNGFFLNKLAGFLTQQYLIVGQARNDKKPS
ncbi:MAG: class I SAM-dependent methyltransferase [Candidatus Omnitrophota bacterium]